MELSKETYEEVKDFVISTVVKQAMGMILVRIPWFGTFTPVVWVATKLLTKLVKFLVEETALGVNLILIQLQVDGQVEGIEEVLAELKLAQDEEHRDALEKELIEVSRRLIRLRDNFRLPIDPT